MGKKDELVEKAQRQREEAEAAAKKAMNLGFGRCTSIYLKARKAGCVLAS